MGHSITTKLARTVRKHRVPACLAYCGIAINTIEDWLARGITGVILTIVSFTVGQYAIERHDIDRGPIWDGIVGP